MPAITQLFKQRSQVALIEESALDTYELPTGTDMFLAELPDNFYTVTSENYQITTVRGDFLSPDEVPTGANAQITFRVPLTGGTGAGVAPQWSQCLLACGYREEIVASTSVTYFPFSTFDGAADATGPPIYRNPYGSATVAVFQAGLLHTISGAHGNVVFTGTVNEPMFAEFTFTGSYRKPVDDALESPTYDSVASPLFAGASVVVNPDTYIPKGISSITLDTGNNVVPVADVNNTEGFYGARITSRKSVGTIDPEMVLVATKDWFTEWRNGTAIDFTTGVIGSTAGNRYELKVNRAIWRPPEFATNENILKGNFPFAVSSAGSDVEGTNLDVELVFT